MSDVSDLEAEAAASRARLNDTIGRIQNKLTLSGMVDEVIGRAEVPKFVNGEGEGLAGFLRRHPLPVMVAAFGIGLLVNRLNGGRRNALPPEEGARAGISGSEDEGAHDVAAPSRRAPKG